MNWTNFENNLSDADTLAQVIPSEIKTYTGNDSEGTDNDGNTITAARKLAGNCWAPDVIYNTAMNKWCMYLSVNGDNQYSCIVLLTADNLDGAWSYMGPVVFSGITSSNIGTTDYKKVTGSTSVAEKYSIYRNSSANLLYGVNAIDPAVSYDDDGNLWMSYGSWFGGIYLLKLNSATGLRDYDYTYENNVVDDTSGEQISDSDFTQSTYSGGGFTAYSDVYLGIHIAGGHHATAGGEGSYILKIGDWYYLFISYGGYAPDGGYNMRVFRSETITGFDSDGNFVGYQDVSGNLSIFSSSSVTGSVGQRVMSGYSWSWWDFSYVAQGHNSVLLDDDGSIYLVYHNKYMDGTTSHVMKVHQLLVNSEGWLVTSPMEATIEDTDTVQADAIATGLSASDIAGTYGVLYMTNSNGSYGSGVSEQVLTLNENGTIGNTSTNTWTYDSETGEFTFTYNFSLTLPHTGYLMWQNLEGTNIRTLVFTGQNTTYATDSSGSVRYSGATVWGYQYPSEEAQQAYLLSTYAVPSSLSSEAQDYFPASLTSDIWDKMTVSLSDLSIDTNEDSYASYDSVSAGQTLIAVPSSATSVSITFTISGYSSDWTPVLKGDSFTLNLSTLIYNSTDIYEAAATNSGLTGITENFQMFLSDEAVQVTVSFNADGSVSLYKNDTLALTYAADTTFNDDSTTIASFCAAVIKEFVAGTVTCVYDMKEVSIDYSDEALVPYSVEFSIEGLVQQSVSNNDNSREWWDGNSSSFKIAAGDFTLVWMYAGTDETWYQDAVIELYDSTGYFDLNFMCGGGWGLLNPSSTDPEYTGSGIHTTIWTKNGSLLSAAPAQGGTITYTGKYVIYIVREGTTLTIIQQITTDNEDVYQAIDTVTEFTTNSLTALIVGNPYFCSNLCAYLSCGEIEAEEVSVDETYGSTDATYYAEYNNLITIVPGDSLTITGTLTSAATDNYMAVVVGLLADFYSVVARSDNWDNEHSISLDATTLTCVDANGNAYSDFWAGYLAIIASCSYTVTVDWTGDNAVLTIVYVSESAGTYTMIAPLNDDFAKNTYSLVCITVDRCAVYIEKYSYTPASTDLDTVINYSITAYYEGKTVDYVNGGTVTREVVQSGSTITLETLSKDGYTFGGWSDGTNTYEGGTTYTVTANVTLTTQWTVITYTITYDLNGGTLSGETTSYTIESETITLPTPTREGYTFAGWYAESDFSGSEVTQIASGSTGNVALYASWTVNSYDITYELGVENGTHSNVTSADYGSTVTLTFDLTKEDYYLSGVTVTQTDDSSVSVGVTKDNGSYSFTMPAYAVTVTVEWTEVGKYAVTYAGGADGVTGLPSSESYAVGDTVTLSSAEPTRTGYTFTGWLVTANNEEVTVTDGAFTMPAYAVTVTAQWTAVSYTITYNLNGGTLSGQTTSYTIESETITLVSPTRTGYTFAGWYTTSALTGDAVTQIASGSTGNVTLYASWTANSYTVSFSTGDSSITVTYGGTYGTLPTPTQTGYTFAGWYLNEDYSGDAVTAETTVSITADTTLYAKWTAVSYTITYNLNGGTLSDETTSYTIESDTITLVSPTKTGYTFAGWYTTSALTGDAVTQIASGSTGNVTLYASWTANTYTVSFSTGDSSITVTYGGTYGTLPTPTQTGYTFAGWYLSEDYSGDAVTAETTVSITADTTLYAKWTANTYTVSFSTGDTAVTVTYGDTYGTLPSPTQTGYTFAGWYLSENYSGDAITAETTVSITADTTLYAKWTAVSYTVTLVDGDESTPTAYDYGTQITLTSPTKDGYTFDGWSDGTDTYAGGTTYTVTGDVTLTAQWTKNKKGCGSSLAAGGAAAIVLLCGAALIVCKKSKKED